MMWAGHVARREGMRNVYKILVENLEGKRPLWKHSADVRMILKWL